HRTSHRTGLGSKSRLADSDDRSAVLRLPQCVWRILRRIGNPIVSSSAWNRASRMFICLPLQFHRRKTDPTLLGKSIFHFEQRDTPFSWNPHRIDLLRQHGDQWGSKREWVSQYLASSIPDSCRLPRSFSVCLSVSLLPHSGCWQRRAQE